MKIAFVVRNYHKSGGISSCAAELAEYLSKHNEVHVFAASWRDVSSPSIMFHKVPMLSFTAFKKRKWIALNNIFEIASFAIASLFILNYKDFDLVHSHGSYAGKSDIFTTHSCHAESLLVSRQNRADILGKFKKTIFNPLHLTLIIIESLALKNAKKVIAVSAKVKKEIIKHYGIDERSIEVIPNGVDLERFSGVGKASTRALIRGKYGFKPQDKVVIFPAHEFERKGLRRLVEALHIIRNEDLYVLIVGQDDEQSFGRLINKCGLQDHLIFAGNVSDVQNYYFAADLMAFPTYYEPFGLVILEAMACGLPVISSRCAGASELIKDNFNGMILDNPSDTRTLARMIIYCTTNTLAAEAMSQNAKKTAAGYSWVNIACQTLKSYQAILKQASAVGDLTDTSFSFKTQH